MTKLNTKMTLIFLALLLINFISSAKIRKMERLCRSCKVDDVYWECCNQNAMGWEDVATCGEKNVCVPPNDF